MYYAPSIPTEEHMPSMVILDASFPIRELEQADSTLKEVKGVSFDFKRYDDLTIYQWCYKSGRDSMRNDFHGEAPTTLTTGKAIKAEWLSRRMAEQKVAKRVALTAAALPLDEAILFFVFKPEQFSQETYRSILEHHLVKQGIDLKATVSVTEFDAEGNAVQVEKPRIVVLTFGQGGAGINDYSYCANVFLVGMLHRDETDVVGHYVAQCDGSRPREARCTDSP